MAKDDQKRDDVLLRMLKTPPAPKKPSAKPGKPADADPMPDDAEGMVEWAKRNIQDE